jgi:hypothetical protein
MWASELVWTQMLEEKSFASAGDRTPVIQSVVRHYNWLSYHSPIIIRSPIYYYEQIYYLLLGSFSGYQRPPRVPSRLRLVSTFDWLIDWLIMMGWDCLRIAATKGPIVHRPSDMWHGEPWWSWYRLGWLLTRPLELSGSPTSRDIWGKLEEWTKEWQFCISVSEIPQGAFNM